MPLSSGYNLPPGCFTSDLPGCSLEDERFEKVHDAIESFNDSEIFNKYLEYDPDWVGEVIYDVLCNDPKFSEREDLPTDYAEFIKFCENQKLNIDEYCLKIGSKLKKDSFVVETLAEKQHELESDTSHWSE